MVSIFTGLGAGFERGSGAALGAGGLLGGAGLGRGGEGVFLNAATGNLILQRQDEFLVGRGPDIGVARTYNSLGALDDNGDYWRQSTDRRIFGLTGTVNTTGSTVKHVSADGSEITYAWNGSAYTTTDGAGAHDKLTHSAGVWTWTDGSTQTKETYASAETDVWRIASVVDSDGNALSFTYVSGSPTKLSRVTTQDGSYLEYTWSGSNITSIVTGYTDLATSTAKTITRTTYGYDGSNRLTSVTVDLTPDNLADAATYTTAYTYDGSTNRIASITQTDGSSLAITYDGSGRVATLTQTVASGDTRVTTLAYYSDRTEVTDPRGSVTKLYYDANKQLTKVVAPAAQSGATPQEVLYEYDTSGNVTKVTDAGGGITEYTYDSAGNVSTIEDPLGNVTERFYDSNNNLIRESRNGSTGSSASTALHTRYVYDSENHLRYAISAEGRVTEYRYTSQGELQYTITYPAHAYTPGSTAVSEATMNTWRDGLADRSTTQIVKNVYDARGNLSQTLSYGAATTAGVEATSEGYAHLYLTYDEAGRLLKRHLPPQVAEQFVYDGMGRLIASFDLSVGWTNLVFNDGATTTTITDAAGLSVVSTFNKAGELISRVESGANVNGGTRSYLYDKNGQVRRVVDATGYKAYVLYDRAGRKIADVGHGGQILEYKYGAGGELIATVKYNTLITSAQLAQLDDPNSEIEIASLRPAATVRDLLSWTIYDANGRVAQTIQGDGSITNYAYDAAGRLVATRGYYNKLASGVVSGYLTSPPATPASVATHAKDVIVRSFYDGDGRLIGALDGTGVLSEITYDGAGRKVAETTFANATALSDANNADLRATGTFAQLRASIAADATRDATSRYVYDGQGLLRFTIDAIGRVTEYIYWGGVTWHAIGPARKTIAYATPLGTLGQYTYATVKAAITTNTADRHAHAVYNSKGQLVYAVDAQGAVTQLTYDALGRVIKSAQFAVSADMSAMGAGDQWEANLNAWAASNGTGARITRNYYAARGGDVIFSIDAEGYVTKFDYDKEGRVYTRYRFVNKVAPVDSWAIADVVSADKGAYFTYGYRYDGLGRLTHYIDANGVTTYTSYHANGLKGWEISSYGQGVDERRTIYTYDQAGRVIIADHYQTEAWNTSSAGSTVTQLNLGYRIQSPNGQYNAILTREGELRVYHKGEVLWSSGSREIVSGATYRLVAQTDGNLVIYRDVTGQSSVAIWNSGTAGAHSGATFLQMQDDGNLVFNKGTAPTSGGVIWATNTQGATAGPYANDYIRQTYAYDGLGNLVSTTDFNGVTTAFTYDRAGRVLTRVDASGTALARTTTFEYDTFGRGVKTTDAANNAAYAYFDRLGRVTLAIDAMGYATETTYTAFGEVGSVIRRMNATSGAAVGAPPTITANAADATTSFEYDNLGRVTKTTDALGAYEQYNLNAFGQRTAVRNKIGGWTDYVYDKLGRVTSETIWFETYNGPTSKRVTNAFAYDSRGNLVTKTEALGLSEERVTTYAYDAGDRLISKSGEAVSVATSATGALSSVTPTEYFYYDRRGNLIEKRDAAGARTLFWYDKLDRVTHSLSASGALTRHWYDKNGNLVETRTYETLQSLPTDAKGLPPSGGASAYRVTQYQYDALNRLTKTIVPNITTAAYTSALAVTSGNLETTYTYDAMNNVVLVTDPRGSSTWSYYDKLGRKTVQVDAALYRTDWSYDANGNVTSERRYATAQASAPSSTTSAPTAPATNAADRVTDFTYDKMGRRLTEARANVAVHNGTGGTSSVTSTITYTYNALSQVLSKTEATGDAINYTYDLGGRMTREQRSAFTDVNGASVTPTVEYEYNGLNNLTLTRALGAGGAIAAAERTSTYAYDGAGRLASVTDAEGFKRAYVYDVTGRIIREEYNRLNFTAAANEAVGYDYDLEGRVVQQGVMLYQSGAWTRTGANIDTVVTQYNAYGEVSARGMNGLYAEAFHYDGAGRLWRSNTGDGVWRYFLYDGAGNQTLVIASEGTAIGEGSLTSLSAVLDLWGANRANIGTTYVDGVVATITKYDARNQAIEVREPQRELSTVAGVTSKSDLITTRAYNAFGEVAYEINAAGARFDYSYNTMGRLTKVQSPSVQGVGENGQYITGYNATTYAPIANSATATTFRPEEHRYYDASGRLVASRDGNGNLTRMVLLAGTGYGGSGALASETIYADGGVIRVKYDIHGDARRIEDQLYNASTSTVLNATKQDYDKLGRLIKLDQSGILIEHYRYDGLGQRTKRWNTLLNPTNNENAAGLVETFAYDHQGRLTQHVAMGGDTTSYAYAWNGAHVTAGMGSFGGWTETTTYANSKTIIEKTDVFGRTIQKTDMGARVSDSSYDKAGRLVQRTGGEALNLTYYNTGRLQSQFTMTGTVVSMNWTRRETLFGYDAVGNQTSEKYTESGELYEEGQFWNAYDQAWEWYTNHNTWSDVLKNATASYDALGRITNWSEAGTTYAPAASRAIFYDANSNIRRTTSVFKQLNAQGVALSTNTTQDYWYRFDSMNRVVTQMGQLTGGAIVRGGQGTDIFYDLAGNRAYTLRSFADQYTEYEEAWENGELVFVPIDYPFTNTQREDYTYDALSRLTQVRSVNGTYWDPNPTTAGVLRAAYAYDAMGRLTSQTDYDQNGTTVLYSRVATYNAKSQITTDTTNTKRGNVVYKGVSTYDYGTGLNYALGAALSITTANYENNSFKNNSLTTNTYQWWDGAVQNTIQFKPNTSQSTTNTSTYYYDYLGGAAQVRQVSVADGRARSITYKSDLSGQVMRRDEADNNASNGDPHEIWYRFGGREMGYVGNNGTLNTDYVSSVANRTAAQGTGAFRNGSSAYSSYADFDQSLNRINSYEQGSAGSGYTVRAGETLSSIASNLWGDSSLWWKLAEANGLSGDASLAEGQVLNVPAGVLKNTHNASTFQPYDPNEAIGETAPTTPKAPKPKKNKCGGFGAVIVAIVAVVVAAIVAPYAIAAIANLAPGVQGITAAMVSKTMAAGLAISKFGAATVMAGGAIAGAAGSVVSQGVGVVTGIQEKFSWNAVALAAVGGGVGASGGWGIGSAALRQAAGSVVTQGIGVATGLQDSFSWAGVAAAGLSTFIPGNIGPIGTVAARTIVNGATRTLFEGGDFGDNVLAALPDVVGQTIGEAIAGEIARANEPEPVVAEGDGEYFDGFALRFGDADPAQVQANAAAEIELLKDALSQATGEDALLLHSALIGAMSHYELAGGAGSLRASGLVPDGNELVIAEAYRRGADDLAADMLADDFFAGADIGQVLAGFRDGAAGEAFGRYLDNTITLASLDEIPGSVIDARSRSNIVRSLGAGRGAFKREIEGILYGAAAPAMLARSPFAGLEAGFLRSADNGLDRADLTSFQAGLHEAAGRATYTGLLSMAAGGAVFGALSRNVRSGLRLTLDMLDNRGRFLGVHNAGPHTPTFKNWLSYSDRGIEILPGGAIRYGRIIDGRGVSVTYRDGFPDFSPFMRHPSGVRSVTIENMTGTPADFRAANAAAGRPEWGRAAPEDWTWHHHQDGRTMQLIPTNINDKFPHIGGAAIVRRRAGQ
ncbi:HNH endonuclease [Vitreimonas flagellata]|uniref:HNH endonuclease n=1 Tax=Vitreimonas flagellata TaxID=2560861 RepID=UPI00107527FA|nr:HNH endonuclease [Vitreimonas flagellata]